MAHPDRPSISPVRAALAGGLGAAAALATGELVTALGHDRPSLVAAVANRFVDRFAAPLKDLAIRLFGTNDKVALVVGIVVVSVLVGAGMGLLARRRFGLAVAGFVGFGVIGAWSFTADARGKGALGYLAALAAVVAGVAVTRGLLGRPTAVVPAGPMAAPIAGPMAGPTEHAEGLRAAPVVTAEPIVRPGVPNRRTFLVRASAIGAGVLVATAASRGLRGGGTAAAARRRTVIPKPASARTVPATTELGLPGLSPYITPTADFYRIDTAILTPDVDPEAWTLTISGLVDRPYSITYAELLELATVSEPVTLQCVSNEVGGDLVGTAVWQGVPLADLLDRAGVQPGAGQIVGRSVDGWTAGFPTEHATDGRVAMVAVAMNGEPLPVRHGFPARLVVAGLYGYVSATKWLSSIELTTWDGFDGYWIPRGWGKEGPIKTSSRIDVPRSGASIPAGRQPIAGVAWAPGRGIDRVEVQIGDGEWQECRLAETASEHTWVQWVLEWDAPAGSHRIRVRATDSTGETQTEERAAPAPDGATGWHQRTVKVLPA